MYLYIYKLLFCYTYYTRIHATISISLALHLPPSPRRHLETHKAFTTHGAIILLFGPAHVGTADTVAFFVFFFFIIHS